MSTKLVELAIRIASWLVDGLLLKFPTPTKRVPKGYTICKELPKMAHPSFAVQSFPKNTGHWRTLFHPTQKILPASTRRVQQMTGLCTSTVVLQGPYYATIYKKKTATNAQRWFLMDFFGVEYVTQCRIKRNHAPNSS